VTRTFFQSTLPPELYDAAQIDGCSIQRYFFSIVLPLSKPVVAIMALYYAVGHWNDFFNGLIYINSQELFPLQLILRDILLRGQAIQAQGVTDPAQLKLMQQISMTIKYGVIIVSSLPILLFYPFVQKYFVKGIMVGSLKG
jgi:putative aldouronate transport system permease protein